MVRRKQNVDFRPVYLIFDLLQKIMFHISQPHHGDVFFDGVCDYRGEIINPRTIGRGRLQYFLKVFIRCNWPKYIDTRRPTLFVVHIHPFSGASLADVIVVSTISQRAIAFKIFSFIIFYRFVLNAVEVENPQLII